MFLGSAATSIASAFYAAARRIDVAQDFSQHSRRAAPGGRTNRECLP
jgi:hypothetical protein